MHVPLRTALAVAAVLGLVSEATFAADKIETAVDTAKKTGRPILAVAGSET